MRRIFFIALTFTTILTFAQDNDEWYHGRPIRNIVFEGLNHVRVSEIEGIIEPFIGRGFTDEIYWDLLGRLYALEYFDMIIPTASRADPAGNEVIIRFRVTERPVVSRINFIGNTDLRRNELLDVVSIRVNDVATQIKLRLDEIAIVNRYIEKGFPDVQVRSEMQDAGNSTLIINFHIEEGEKIAIEEFRFEGNTIFSSRTLQRQLSLRTRGIFNDGAFQEARLIADRQALAQYYHERGYIDAVVVDDIREIRRDDRGNNLMTITFRIYEGRLYNFGGITFEGNRIFSTEQLSGRVQSRVGEVANSRRIQADLERVRALYFENGYIFNFIEPQVSQDEETGVFSIHIFIIERGRAHIENIIILGNTKTRDHVILDEIPLEPGDIFSQTKVIDGMRNLMNTMFFSSVIPEPVPGSVDHLMDLIINVEEQSTMDLEFGLAFSGTADPDAFPVSVHARWNDRNIRGTGNRIGIGVSASPEVQYMSVEYAPRRLVPWMALSGSFDFTIQHARRLAATNNRYPWFYNDDRDKDIAFPDGFGSYEEYIRAGRIPPSEYLMPYNQWQVSMGLATGYRWNTFLGSLGLRGGTRIGMINNFFNDDLYRPFDPVLRDTNNIWTPAISFWSSISLDQRDIYWDPTRGYFGSQRIGYYGLLQREEEHYIRTDTTLQWFTTLWDLPVTENWSFRAVFGVHSGVSFIFPKPGYNQPRIEAANQLAVDGMFTGRGWNSEFYRKGLALWDNWAEVRIPLVPGILAWDFFIDAAGIKDTPKELFTTFWDNDNSNPGYDTFFMRFSVGGGIRFSIPQFPIRFSMAKRFKITDGSLEWVPGAIGRNPDRPSSGMDLVISFNMPIY